jgi:hypothetical protein
VGLRYTQSSYKPILGFDTSAINALADSKDRDNLIAGLRSGYHIRLTSTNVEEISANKNRERMNDLLNVCRQLLFEGDCIWPHHWIIEKLICHHAKDPHCNWISMSPLAHAYEQEIVRREILSEALARQQRECMKSLNAVFENLFITPRPEFEALFSSGTTRPSSFHEFLPHIHDNGRALWKYGQTFYKRVAGRDQERETIRRFAIQCPPFHALLLAVAMAQWERSVRDIKTSVSYRAGREDLWTSVYLPYCELFVTSDPTQQ